MRPLALREEEKAIVAAVLWFANLKRIKSTKQIEDRFSLLPLVPGIFKVIEPEKVDAYRYDQAVLRRWLGLITKGQAGRKSAEIEVTNQLAATVDTELGFSQGRIIYQYGLTGVQAICSFGAALILITATSLQLGSSSVDIRNARDLTWILNQKAGHDVSVTKLVKRNMTSKPARKECESTERD